jgi:hypothetical protein
MDKRREPRFVADQSVTVTLLRDPETRVPARVKDSSGRGLGLVSSLPVLPGTALKIEMDDSVILGEAVYCRKDRDYWFIGVELNQVLAGLAELGRRLQEFSAELSGRQAVYALEHRHAENRQQNQ